MKIKICGITNLADARFAAAAGADFLGYIQHKESPRYTEPDLVSEINAWVAGPAGVGVFVDEDVRTINLIIQSAGFEYVQLHGRETVAMCAEVECKIIKAFHVPETATADDLKRKIEPYLDSVEYILLDTFSRNSPGGTGRTFSWSIARKLAPDYPLILAGGLGPENVAEAIETVQPAGVDASSKLEESPGTKDFDKITAFVGQIRG